MLVMTRTPLRVSFIGGGTDLPTYYAQCGGSVITTAIQYFIDIIVRSRNHHHFNTYKITYENVCQEVSDIDAINHPIIRECLKYVGINEFIEIQSFSDVRSGLGLGSSSAFTVGLLLALYSYCGKKNISWEKLSQEAYHIEAKILKRPIGKQDHGIAAFGSICQLFFNKDHSIASNSIHCNKETLHKLENNLMLFQIGDPRNAGEILKSIKPDVQSDQYNLLNQLHMLCDTFRKELENGSRLHKVGELLHESWTVKRRLSNSISNKEIDKTYEISLANGAIGGKLLGAGGGGFLLLYVDRNKQHKVRECLSNYQELPFKFFDKGSHILLNKRLSTGGELCPEQ